MLLLYLTYACNIYFLQRLRVAQMRQETRDVAKSRPPAAEKIQPQVLRCGKGLAICLQASYLAVGMWGRCLYGDALPE